MNSYLLKAFIPIIFIGGICLYLEAKIGFIHENESSGQTIKIAPKEVFVNSPITISINPTQKNIFWIIEENINNDTNLQYIFHAPGDKLIYAIIDNRHLDTFNINVTEPPKPLTIKITTPTSKDSIPVGDSVQFIAECNKKGNFKWVCNDSNQKTGDTVFYTFTDSGSYAIELTAESDEVLVVSKNIFVYRPKIIEKIKPTVIPKQTPIIKAFTISENQVRTLLQDIVDDPKNNFDDNVNNLEKNTVCKNITFNIKYNGETHPFFSISEYGEYLKEIAGTLQIISVTFKGNCSCTIIQQ